MKISHLGGNRGRLVRYELQVAPRQLSRRRSLDIYGMLDTNIIHFGLSSQIAGNYNILLLGQNNFVGKIVPITFYCIPSY